MNRTLVLLVLCSFPSVALAAPGAHLLGHRLTLGLGAVEGGAAPADLSAPPPPPPLVPLEDAAEPAAEPAAAEPSAAEPSASLDLTHGEGPPSLGPVLGFLISGWVAVGVGGIFAIDSFTAFSQAATSRFNSSEFTAVGVTFLVIALIHVGIGIPLVVVGFQKKSARNSYYEQHPNAWLQPGTDGRLAVFSF